MIDVVIPTRGRAGVLEALTDNLHKTSELTPRFVVDRDDPASIHVAEMCGHVTISTVPRGYPQKANLGYRCIPDPAEWCLIGGDDVVFHDGWYEAALKAVQQPYAFVVAPNDCSPLAGVNATFPIVWRRYIDTEGGAWGEPGNVYHEAYRHNFSDTELWMLAKHRGVARYAEDCRIEHLHPSWKKGEVDETYKRGGMNEEGWAHDETLYLMRRERWSD